MKLNEYKTVIGAELQYFDAWRKLCNIYFIVAPANIVPFQLRFSLLMELIRSVLQLVRWIICSDIVDLRNLGVQCVFVNT